MNTANNTPNTEENQTPETNLVETTKFPMQYDPHDWVVCVHINNLMATYGEEYVKNLFKELYLPKAG